MVFLVHENLITCMDCSRLLEPKNSLYLEELDEQILKAEVFQN